MLAEFAGHLTVYLVTGYTDMRKSIKALLWDDDGFVLLYKRLDNGCFKWPRTETEARLLSSKELRWLLDGLELDQPKAIKSGTKGVLY